MLEKIIMEDCNWCTNCKLVTQYNNLLDLYNSLKEYLESNVVSKTNSYFVVLRLSDVLNKIEELEKKYENIQKQVQ